MRQTLTDKERNTISHALNVAGMRFRDDVKTWQEVQPGGFVTAAAIPQMVELFTSYAVACEELHEKLIGVGLIEIDDGTESEVR